jgi:hypothetical protein
MLTRAQINLVLEHLDYTLLTLPTSLSAGLPVVTQADFLARNNLNNLDPLAEPRVLQAVERLECIHKQMDEVRSTMSLQRTGGTVFRDDALDQLDGQYKRFQRRLADLVGAQPNPVSNAAYAGSGGVIEGC